MGYQQKYTIVHFLRPLKDGAEFAMTKWPLHVGFTDVFAVDRVNVALDAKLSHLLANCPKVKTRSVSHAKLSNTEVVLIDKNEALYQLHVKIVTLLKNNTAVFNHPEFTLSGYVPHSSMQKNESLPIGQEVVIDSISLVDMFPDNDWKKRRILKTFILT